MRCGSQFYSNQAGIPEEGSRVEHPETWPLGRTDQSRW